MPRCAAAAVDARPAKSELFKARNALNEPGPVERLTLAPHRCAADGAACMPVETIGRSIGRATRRNWNMAPPGQLASTPQLQAATSSRSLPCSLICESRRA